MQAQRVQHVHAHYATHPALAAFVAHRLTGIPYSFTVHAHDLFVQRAMLRRKARNAAFIVTISEYNRTLLTQVAGEMAAARTVVVRTGTDLSRFTPPEQREGVFTILSVASLEPYKGQRHLVEACARLKAQGVPFRCIFVGGGPDRAALEMLTRRLGLARSGRFLGPRAREDVVHQMRSAHVLALPSVTTASGKKEGIPVVLMEALATELAVVATSLSGIPELIEDGVTGVLVPERDARSLADALARLADDPPLRERLGRAGRERVLAGYDIRQSGERLAALFTRARAQTEPA
jgi:glycosyltransferase involved in cell wall biosynthesis